MLMNRRDLPKKCPPITPALVDYMAAKFEKPLASLDNLALDPGEVGKLIGKAKVVEWMRQQMEAQTNNLLE